MGVTIYYTRRTFSVYWVKVRSELSSGGEELIRRQCVTLNQKEVYYKQRNVYIELIIVEERVISN